MRSLCLFMATALATVNAYSNDPAPRAVTITHSALGGIGSEPGVMRRDPSDIINVDGLYYVWYSKGRISPVKVNTWKWRSIWPR